MYDEILEAKNKFLVKNGRQPKYLILNRVGFSILMSEYKTQEQLDIQHTGLVFGMEIAVLWGPYITDGKVESFFEVA